MILVVKILYNFSVEVVEIKSPEVGEELGYFRVDVRKVSIGQ